MLRNIIRLIYLIIFALIPIIYYLVKDLDLLPTYKEKAYLFEILFIVPYILFSLVAFLGLRLNQTRIFFTIFTWAIIYLLLTLSVENTIIKVQLESFAKSVSLVLPFIIIFIFLLNEGQLIGFQGVLRFISVVASIFFCVWLAENPSPFTTQVLSAQFFLKFENSRLPELLWLPLTGLVLFFFFRPDRSILPFKIGVIITFLPMLFALNISAMKEITFIDAKIFNSVSFSVMGLIFLHAMYKIYWQKVYIDELSSISNRRAFNEFLRKLGRKYTIAMVDIDYFKKFNDRYGHEEGDNVIRYVANHLREESAAVVFRYGGEEFSLVYRGLNMTDVFWRVDRMREKLAKKSFHIRVPLKIRQHDSAEDRGKKVRNTKKVKVNISVGIAQRSPKLRTARDVINAADKALYRAKSNGRNQCAKARNI